MKVQAMPVQPKAGSGTAAAQQGNAPKEDFLSILKKRTENTADRKADNGKEPVQKAGRKAEKKPGAKEKSQDFEEAGALNGQIQAGQKDGTESDSEAEAKIESAMAEDTRVSGEANVSEEGQRGFLTAEAILQNLAGQNAIPEITGEAKQLYGQSSMLSGSESNVLPLNSSLEAIAKKAETAAGIPAVPGESAKGSSSEIFAEALQNKAGPAREIPQLKDTVPGKEMQPEIVKTSGSTASETGAQSSNTGSDMEDTGKESQEQVRWFSLNESSRGEQSLKSMENAGKQGQDADTVSLEELQKKAEQGAFLPFERLVGAKLSGGAMAQVMDNRGVTDATPLPDQLRTGIEQGLSRNLNQFTIRLKPEGLGEILVHMTSTGGKIALSIGVSSLETQKLLSSEMMHLKETMQPLNAEVQEIYHNSQGGMEMMNYEQGFYQNQQRDTSGSVHRHVSNRSLEEEDEAAADIPEAVKRYAGLGRLSAYI